MPVLVLGTRNRKKRSELVDLLDPFGLTLRTLDEFPQSVEVDETGTTFAENAALKATQQAKALGQWVLGEDSGLCVVALGNAPGVYSARFAGQQGDDEANNNKLLAELGDRPPEERTAFYVCHAVLSDPQGQPRASAEGRCYGRILTERVGSAGFGYDPLFLVPEYHRTFGELGEAVKGAISHRARAMRQIIPQIVRLVANQET